MKRNKGFTLIELLVVIAIVVILMAATLVAINPFEQIARANNASRWAGVNAIVNAVNQVMIDGAPVGSWLSDDCTTPATLPTTPTNISSATGVGDIDLCGCLVDYYLGALPFDPQDGKFNSCSDYDTKYSIEASATDGGRITISATGQLGETIEVTQ